MRVLFVCSGNICRSPMAEALFREVCDSEPGLAHVAVDSAGTLGLVGRPASPEAVRALAERGVDLEGHRSRALDAERLRAADVTLVMTWDHQEEIARRFPEAGGDRFLLRAFERDAEPSTDPEDLADPIGEPLDVYRSQLPILDACLENLALWVKHPGVSSLRRYARRIEELWSARLERPVILSPREFALIEDWHGRGIPLSVVASAIESTRTDARGRPAPPPRRLGYVGEAVEEAWRTVVEGRLREAHGNVEGSPPPAGVLAAWEAAARRGPPDWRRRVADLVERARAGEAAQEIDRRLDEALVEAAPADAKARVAEDVERRLAPHARRMEPDVLERTRRRATVDGLRRDLDLPRLR